MRFENILVAECTQANIAISSKKKAIQTIAESLSQYTDDIDVDTLYTNLIGREKLGSTGIGQGIAIPHCRIPTTHQLFAVCLTLSEPIDFESIDGRPVDVIFAMIVPEQCGDVHLTTLAEIAKAFQNTDITKRIRSCTNSRELYQTIIQLN